VDAREHSLGTPILSHELSQPCRPCLCRVGSLGVTEVQVSGSEYEPLSTHAISGPPEGYKACEDAVRKWVFKPYLVLGQPVEVEQKVECSNN
jgi:hypothetical protein